VDARASRPWCRKRRRPARGTNSSWALAAVPHRRDSKGGGSPTQPGQRASAAVGTAAVAVAKVAATTTAVKVVLSENLIQPGFAS
jgi:hypothetical protein